MSSVPQFCNQDNVKAFFAAAAAANHSNNNNSNGNGGNQPQPPQPTPPPPPQQSQQLYHDQQQQFGHHQQTFDSHQINPNLIANRDSINQSIYLINQKLSHLNLTDGLTTTDLNGNSHHHHQQLVDHINNHHQQHQMAAHHPSDSSNNGNSAYFSDMIGPNQNVDEMQQQQQQQAQQQYQNYHTPNQMNQWNVDFVLNNLRNKLGTIKQIQSEVQSSYLDGQNQFTSFINQCRVQLNAVYAELSEELDQHFKSRMIEMSQQQNQIEDILLRIEQKQIAHIKSNGVAKGNATDENLLNLFDNEFVGFVKNILDCSISSGDDFRLPNVDNSLIDRSIRSLMYVLFNKLTAAHPLYGQYGCYPGASYAGGPQGQSTAAGPASAMVPAQHPHASHHHLHHPTSSNSDSDNFVPENIAGTFMPEPGMHLQAMNSMGPTMYANCWPTNMMPNSQQAAASNKQAMQPGGLNSASGHGYPMAVDLNRTNFSTNNGGTSSNNATNSNTAGSNTPFYPYVNNDDSINSHYYNSGGFNGGPGNNGANLSQQQKQILNKSLQPKIRRERMTYFCKFGEQGALDGQFAEPSGVAVTGANSDIFIADANNHRIQVFDRWGKFKFHFGEGKLKFPNRVAISRNTGEIVVSERPPVHQIQVYNKSGNFICKFGSKHLRHPRGLTVDHKNRVVVVECKVMRVFIFNLRGDLLHSFDCSQQIQFPNAVVVSKKEEIFISDNRNHCVKVFSFAGEFLRQIGGQGITNYPIGVCLNESNGQLLVVDNYNNLNVTMFRIDGQLIGAFESSVKHQQCLDVAILGDNSIVVTSKDLQVYIYRLKDCSNNVITNSSINNHNNNNGNTSTTNGNNNNNNSSSSSSNGNNNNNNSNKRPIGVLNNNNSSSSAACSTSNHSNSNLGSSTITSPTTNSNNSKNSSNSSANNNNNNNNEPLHNGR